MAKTSWMANGNTHRSKSRLPGSMLVAVLYLCSAGSAGAQLLDPLDAIARISAQDIAESLVSFNNFTAAPGIEGGNLDVDLGDGQPNLKYSRINIQIPITIKTPIDWLNVYTEIGYGGLLVEDNFTARTILGETLSISSDRTVNSGRLGLGVEFLPIPELHIAPYFAAAFSGIESKTEVEPPFDPILITPEEGALLQDWDANAWSVGGVLDVKWLHWVRPDRHRLDLQGSYAISWTETFNESFPILETAALRNTLVFEALWRSITDVRVLGKQLSWNVFANNTSFPGQEKDDLGFTYYFGFGAGIDLYIPERLWGKIGRNFIGLRASGLVGDDATGWSVVFSFRN